MNPFFEESFRKLAQSDDITHISTGIAIVRDKKILIVRRAAADYLGGQYELPGGGVDLNETISEAAIREVKEETGLRVSRIITAFDGFDYTTDRKPHVRQINFLVEVEPGEVVFNPEEHDQFQWVDLDTDLAVSMSANMATCVAEALRLARQTHLYLLTLEVTPLIVGNTYNPLPSHLTLVSRFRSELSPDIIARASAPVFSRSRHIELIYGNEAVIGPKRTAVHLIEQTAELMSLHMRLVEALAGMKVMFTLPQFIGQGYRPHVSTRPAVQFAAGYKQTAEHAYLIEVKITGKEQIRRITAKFDLRQ